MYNQTQFANGQSHNIGASNVQTIDNNTVEILHQVIIQDLPNDPGNDDMITTDAFNRLYKLPISSLPVPNIFDQDLNSFDSPTFNSVTTDLIQEEGLNAGITLNNRVILPNITTANSVNSILSVDFASFNVEKTVATVDASGRLVVTNLNTGQGQNELYPMDQAVRTTDSPQFDSLTINDQILIPNMAIQGGVYPFITLDGGSGQIVKNNNILLTPSGDVLALFGSVNGSSLVSSGLITGMNLTLSNITIDNTENKILVLGAGNTVEYRDVSSLPTAGGDVLGPISSTDNAIPKYDGITGKIIQNTGLIIDDFNDLTSPGTITCDTDELALELDSEYVIIKKDNDELKKVLLDNLFGQGLSVIDNVTHNNIIADNLLQTDTILENTLNNGVDITSWNISPQQLTSQGIISETNPLSINLDLAGDSDSLIQISGEEHNRLHICFDCHHLEGGTRDQYISSSFDGNFILEKVDDSLDFLATNGITKGTGFSKNAMNLVAGYSKTQMRLQQTVVMAGGFIASALPTDPETLGTILITKSSLTDEIWKRPYNAVYCSATNNASPVLALPVIGTYVLIPASYALSFAKNCTAVSNSIVIDAAISQLMYRCSYSISFISGTNSSTQYEFAIIVNGFNITASRQSITMSNNTDQMMVSNNFLFLGDPLDDISLFVRNNTSTQSISIDSMTITINNIFE